MRFAFLFLLASAACGASWQGDENIRPSSRIQSPFPLMATAFATLLFPAGLLAASSVMPPLDIMNVQLQVQGSKKCLDVINYTTGSKRSPLGINDCTGKDNQNWDFKFTGLSKNVDGVIHYPIFNVISNSSKRCLTVSGGDDGSTVVDELNCEDSPNQHWYRSPVGNNIDYFNLVGVQSGKCLTVFKIDTTNSPSVGINDCNEGSNEMWTFTKQQYNYI